MRQAAHVATTLALLAVTLIANFVCPVFAQEDVAAQCLGMSRELKLPDEKVFKTFVELDREKGRIQFGGDRSDYFLSALQDQLYEMGYGAGLAHASTSTMGLDFAFKVFMRVCYKDDSKMRKDLLASVAK